LAGGWGGKKESGSLQPWGKGARRRKDKSDSKGKEDGKKEEGEPRINLLPLRYMFRKCMIRGF